MEKMLINERFKSPNKEFEKVYAIFDKRDYFNNKGLAKTQIGNFKRALEKNDKGAQKLLDAHKGNMDSAISYIEEFISDGNKRKSFESFQEFSSMVNALEMSTKPNLKQKPAEFIKRRIHNNSQKYTIALYSAIRKQKFNNYKDVHKDVDELVSKNESVNESKYSIIDPRGNAAGTGTKDQVNRKAKTLGGSKKGYFVVPVDRAKEARRAMERFKFNFKNPKLQDKMSGLYFDDEMFGESVNEAKVDTILKRIKSAYDKSKNKKLDIKKLKDQLKTYKKLGASDKKDQIKAGEMFLKSIGESVNEWDSKSIKAYGNASAKAYGSGKASKLAMGIAGFTGTRGSAVDAFIDSHKIDAKKLFNFVKKGNLKDRMAFVSAIAGKPNNKMFKMITKQFSESTPQGYNPMVEDKSEITKLVKKVNNSETKFYDVLSVMEKKYGKNKYRIWLEKSLKDFGVNPKHYDYRTNAAVEEKLFQLGK